jgi:hypothetical protein
LIEKIDYPLGAGFRPRPLGVVLAVPDHHAPPPILDVFELEAKHLARPESSPQHQQEHRLISQLFEATEQQFDLLLAHGPGHAQHGLDAYRSTHGSLAADATQKGLVAIGGPSESRIGPFADRVLFRPELTQEDEMFVERRDGRQGTVDGRRRQPPDGFSSRVGEQERRRQPLSLPRFGTRRRYSRKRSDSAAVNCSQVRSSSWRKRKKCKRSWA